MGISLAQQKGLRDGKGTYLQAVHPVRTFGLLARRFFTSGVAPSIPAQQRAQKRRPNLAVAGYAAISALKTSASWVLYHSLAIFKTRGSLAILPAFLATMIRRLAYKL